jgi:16S rRNA (guanine527-N7)-methyltransferase
MPINDARLISQYFDNLSTTQQAQFTQLGPIYQTWNKRINLVSRQDIDRLYLHHVLHALSIAKVLQFKPATQVIDVGTGGGFPGIPLAILFPDVHFHLIDSITKKIKAVQAITQELGLHNVTTQITRAEVLKGQFDFVLGRGVTKLTTFYSWVKQLLSYTSQHSLPNGILYLTGEIEPALPVKYKIYPIGQFFKEPFFETKKLVYIPHNI